MAEHWHRSYLKEEEFWDEYPRIAHEVAKLLNSPWKLNPASNDKVRQQTVYLLSRGEFDVLRFDAAYVYHDENGFSSAQIILKSSKRTVNVRVKEINGSLLAEKILDSKGRGG